MLVCDVTDTFQSCSDSGRRRLCGGMTHLNMCAMTYSCDSFICVSWLTRIFHLYVPFLWLIYMCAVTHSCDDNMCAMANSCDAHMCAMTHKNASFVCVILGTHLYVCRDSFVWPKYVCHGSFLWLPWLILVTRSYACHSCDSFMCATTHISMTRSCDSFMYVPWHTFKWLILVTRLYACHDTHINDSFFWLIHSNHAVQGGVASYDALSL